MSEEVRQRCLTLHQRVCQSPIQRWFFCSHQQVFCSPPRLWPSCSYCIHSVSQSSPSGNSSAVVVRCNRISLYDDRPTVITRSIRIPIKDGCSSATTRSSRVHLVGWPLQPSRVLPDSPSGVIDPHSLIIPLQSFSVRLYLSNYQEFWSPSRGNCPSVVAKSNVVSLEYDCCAVIVVTRVSLGVKCPSTVNRSTRNLLNTTVQKTLSSSLQESSLILRHWNTHQGF